MLPTPRFPSMGMEQMELEPGDSTPPGLSEGDQQEACHNLCQYLAVPQQGKDSSETW